MQSGPSVSVTSPGCPVAFFAARRASANSSAPLIGLSPPPAMSPAFSQTSVW